LLRPRLVLSADWLSGNIDAIVRAQGICPTLGALPDTIRIATTEMSIRAEVRSAGTQWRVIDDSSPAASRHADWLTAARHSGATQVIVVGPALGFAIDGTGGIDGFKKILLVEPDPGLAAILLSRRDWREWILSGRLRLLTGPDYKGAANIARFLDGLADAPVVVHPIRAALQAPSMAAAIDVANRVVQNARANGTARRKFAGPYLLQTLGNLPAIAREADAQALDGAFLQLPAVVVGAGPSLDENVRALKAFPEHALIVAADTALGPLLSNGVTPHLVVAVDSSALNARHLTNVDTRGDAWLAAEGSVHQSALERFAGRTFTFRIADHEPWPWLRAAGVTRGEVKAWGSVLTSAFDLARRFGCDPIVFAGADLAFTGLRPYCRGTIYDAIWQQYIDAGCTWQQLMDDYFARQPDLRKPDIHGDSTRTAPHLVSFRDWLIEQMSLPGSPLCINSTGAGILSGGSVKQLALDEVLGAFPVLPHLRGSLRALHAESAAPKHVEIVEALQAAARVSRERLPLDRWMAFAAGTVTADQLVDALVAGTGELTAPR